MKKVIIIAGIVSWMLSSCTNNKLAMYSDDIYVNPSEERAEKARLAAEKKKQQEELAKKEAEERAAELAAQKAKDDANPLYKDPSYNKDDYYDYEYSSRLRRFNNPVNGVGYYDNYYTNNYFYSGNPYLYGSSIYSSYNYWGPNYSNYGCWPSSYFGVSVSYGYPNYGYGSPYGNYYSNSYWQGYYNGYNNGYYNGYYGYPYGYSYGYPSYGYGYGYPYYGYGYNYNPSCYNGWGYFNAYDANSGYNKPLNAPRGSHDGGNTGRPTGPGKYTDGLVQKYVQEVQVAQATTPKFNSEGRSATKAKSSTYNSNFENTNSIPVQTIYNAGNPTKPRRDLNEGNNVQYNSGNTNTPKDINNGSNEPTFGGNSPTYTAPKNTINSGNNSEVQFNGGGNSNPPKVNHYDAQPHNPVKTNTYENNSPKGNIFDSGSPTFNNGNNNNNSAPSNNSPRGGGNTGGGHRPR